MHKMLTAVIRARLHLHKKGIEFNYIINYIISKRHHSNVFLLFDLCYGVRIIN